MVREVCGSGGLGLTCLRNENFVCLCGCCLVDEEDRWKMSILSNLGEPASFLYHH